MSENERKEKSEGQMRDEKRRDPAAYCRILTERLMSTKEKRYEKERRYHPNPHLGRDGREEKRERKNSREVVRSTEKEKEK